MLRVVPVLACLVGAALASVPLTVTQEIQDYILYKHNSLRNATYSGSPSLTWDTDLADVASIQAARCLPSNTKTGFGQNIYFVNGNKSVESIAVDSMETWGNETENVDMPEWTCVGNLPDHGTCGHYTQMVWKQTLAVGCAVRTACDFDMKDWTVLWCEYSPAGNVVTWNPKTFYSPY